MGVGLGNRLCNAALNAKLLNEGACEIRTGGLTAKYGGQLAMKSLLLSVGIPLLMPLWVRSLGTTAIILPTKPGAMAQANLRKVTFAQSAQTIEAYDFVEVTVTVSGEHARNPFTDATLRGSFGKSGASERLAVDGFCDSEDGGVFRIRFMPSSPGDYTYTVAYKQGDNETAYSGKFKATNGHRTGPIGVDPQYPWHFIWEGTGKHYYFNGTTAFWLMGWREERIINSSIERLHRLKINRIRVLLSGTANILWGEPVFPNEEFKLIVRPWVAQSSGSFDRPGIDYSRFSIPYWQKWERMLRFARDRDVIISVVMDISTHKAQAAAGSDDEKHYF